MILELLGKEISPCLPTPPAYLYDTCTFLGSLQIEPEDVYPLLIKCSAVTTKEDVYVYTPTVGILWAQFVDYKRVKEGEQSKSLLRALKILLSPPAKQPVPV